MTEYHNQKNKLNQLAEKSSSVSEDENYVDGEGGFLFQEEDSPSWLKLMVKSVNENWSHIHDSGASRSKFSNLNILFNTQLTSMNMKTFSGSSNITHFGKLNLNGFILNLVHYSPSGKSNPICQSQLEDNGLRYFRNNQTIIVKAEDRVVKIFNIKGNLDVSDLNPINPINNNILSEQLPNWNITLSHPSDLYLKQYLDINNLESKKSATQKTVRFVCNESSKDCPTIINYPLLVLHLKNSMQIVEKLPQWVIIIDDYSRFNIIYLLNTKSQSEEKPCSFFSQLKKINPHHHTSTETGAENSHYQVVLKYAN
ncbi:hypothetical protein O181_071880 [Austropuccinia psidii MF-1]|uniref:Uncharacterized protein n=1 Tax=Austropuccinia psidii MF-1 TaxID=1389203 RepID=A0A9Q3IAG5_9BASI|nr:hypothetical protein [Austropuccinia psidii MF-1]